MPSHDESTALPDGGGAAGLPARQSRAAQVALASLIMGVFYSWVISNGTYDFLAPEIHGRAFGSLAANMLHGSLAVDQSAIGIEGLYVADKVYMYFGLLPALLRLPLAPFVDLTQVTVSRVIVLALVIPTAATWHWLILAAASRSGVRASRVARTCGTISAFLIAWIISPAFALASTAPIYHETVAAALLISALYTLLVLEGPGEGGVPDTHTLVILAALAALSLHARPTLSIGLYLGTAAFVGLALWRQRSSAHFSFERPTALVRIAAAPALILALSGGVYLWLNWIRWGLPFEPGPSQFWGYRLFLPEYAAEAEQNAAIGRFNWVRMPVNLVAYLTANPDWTEGLRQRLGAGAGRMLEPPSPMAVLWAAPLTVILGGTWARLRRPDQRSPALIGPLVLLAALAVPALLMLSYPTINYRYKLLVWPVVFVAMLLTGSPAARRMRPRTLEFSAIVLLIICVATSVTALQVNTYYKLFRGLNADDQRTIETFALTRLVVPPAQLARMHVWTEAELAAFERATIAPDKPAPPRDLSPQ